LVNKIWEKSSKIYSGDANSEKADKLRAQFKSHFRHQN